VGKDAAVLLAALLLATPASAQSLARFSVDSAIAIDYFAGQNTVDRPNIIVDVTATMRIGRGWLVFVRPWFRQPRNNTWHKEIYQAALQHERSGPISTRVDLGYIMSPIGLGMMDTRPGLNPMILPHLSYVTPMPVFDAGAPRVQPIAASYPLGGQFTASTTKWDARVALTAAPPNRMFVVNASSPNPTGRPVVVVGGGVTPHVGLRLGAAFAAGDYVKANELTAPGDSRGLRMVSVEGEYAFGYSRFSGELTRDSLETGVGREVAYAWFVQGIQTLTPRWFVAGRQEGTNAPPLRTGIVPGTRTMLHITEATVGFRISRDFTLRTSFSGRKPFLRRDWDQQIGASVVWAHRWW
jgi:hypothetical protein